MLDSLAERRGQGREILRTRLDPCAVSLALGRYGIHTPDVTCNRSGHVGRLPHPFVASHTPWLAFAMFAATSLVAADCS